VQEAPLGGGGSAIGGINTGGVGGGTGTGNTGNTGGNNGNTQGPRQQ
jgi:hypothetical protein